MSDPTSDNNKKREYESIGTIYYRASSEISLFFIPDSAHCLKYSANSYAVFVGPPLSDSTNDREALAVRLRDDDAGIVLKKSIPITVACPKKKQDLLQVARRAAEKQTGVTLTVKRDSTSLELVSITLPPR